MYLFIFQDGHIRAVHDNITIADLLAVKLGLLHILMYKNEEVVEIGIANDQIVETIVEEAKVVQGEAGRFHHI